MAAALLLIPAIKTAVFANETKDNPLVTPANETTSDKTGSDIENTSPSLEENNAETQNPGNPHEPGTSQNPSDISSESENQKVEITTTIQYQYQSAEDPVILKTFEIITSKENPMITASQIVAGIQDYPDFDGLYQFSKTPVDIILNENEIKEGKAVITVNVIDRELTATIDYVAANLPGKPVVASFTRMDYPMTGVEISNEELLENLPEGYELKDPSQSISVDSASAANGTFTKRIPVEQKQYTASIHYYDEESKMIVSTRVISVFKMNPVITKEVIETSLPGGYDLVDEAQNVNIEPEKTQNDTYSLEIKVQEKKNIIDSSNAETTDFSNTLSSESKSISSSKRNRLSRVEKNKIMPIQGNVMNSSQYVSLLAAAVLASIPAVGLIHKNRKNK